MLKLLLAARNKFPEGGGGGGAGGARGIPTGRKTIGMSQHDAPT